MAFHSSACTKYALKYFQADTLLWSTTVSDLTVMDDGTFGARCIRDKETFSIRCKYIFACDGTNSTIKKKFPDVVRLSKENVPCFW